MSNGTSRCRLGIAIPLANEAATVDELLTRVLAQLAPADRVYCVVDQASRDDTRARVQAWGERDPRVRLVWAPENRCVVDAYFRGYRAAYEAGCSWILEMDGGLSHLPEQIPEFVRAMERGYDFVAGSRFAAGGSHSGGPWRRFVSQGGTVLANMLLGTRMSDMTSGFECFSRSAMALVLERGVASRAHFFQTEIRHMLRNVRWAEVPIRYSNPSANLHGSNVVEALRQLARMTRARLRGPR